jgi:hypothetical protein
MHPSCSRRLGPIWSKEFNATQLEKLRPLQLERTDRAARQLDQRRIHGAAVAVPCDLQLK